MGSKCFNTPILYTTVIKQLKYTKYVKMTQLMNFQYRGRYIQGLFSLNKILRFFPKKTHSEKLFYVSSEKGFISYFRKWKFLPPSFKEFLYFFKKSFFIFCEMKLFKKTSYISGGNFTGSQNIKKSL